MLQEKKVYGTPCIRVKTFENQDVITSSGDTPLQNNEKGFNSNWLSSAFED